ncbi:MAG: alpha/beta hydrolase [Chloroflexi bacterium]|nr:alpha/beta hydrolase [Chloroflexota bacterium]
MPTVRLSDCELYYEEYGSGDRCVLSAHVSLTPGDSYQKLLASQAGLHVYDIQIRGFGRSTHVIEPPVGGWYQTWANDVVQFARVIGLGRFIYTGVSHGAGIGWSLALDHPEVLEAFVAVVGGPHDRSTPRGTGMGVGSGGAPAPPSFHFVPTHDPVRRQRQEAIRAHLQDRATAMAPEERAINPGKVFPDLASNEEVAARLAQVAVPTLLLYGAQDEIIPVGMALLAARAIPGAKLVLYQDQSHTMSREIPERLVSEVRLFLDELATAQAS